MNWATHHLISSYICSIVMRLRFGVQEQTIVSLDQQLDSTCRTKFALAHRMAVQTSIDVRAITICGLDQMLQADWIQSSRFVEPCFQVGLDRSNRLGRFVLKRCTSSSSAFVFQQFLLLIDCLQQNLNKKVFHQFNFAVGCEIFYLIHFDFLFHLQVPSLLLLFLQFFLLPLAIAQHLIVTRLCCRRSVVTFE